MLKVLLKIMFILPDVDEDLNDDIDGKHGITDNIKDIIDPMTPAARRV